MDPSNLFKPVFILPFYPGLLSILQNSSTQNNGLHSKWMWETGVEINGFGILLFHDFPI